jgi:DNA-binding response OmpR family regulator
VKSGRPVIALVEDEPLLRVPLAQGLDAAGFTVIAAANGPEALALLEDRDIDVTVIDIKLPGRIDGLAVIHEARRSNPGLKAIVISGRRPDEDLSEVGVFLAKPFRLGELIDLLQQALAAGPASPEASRRAPPRLS